MHQGYVSHHNGAQYFGYIANNPALTPNLRGLGDVFDDISGGKLPKDGGVFYVRGGFVNVAGLKPPIQNPNFPAPLTDADRKAIADGKQGDDDHPAYSDRQISEAMAARVINMVAGNEELWKQSAIIVTYDEFGRLLRPRTTAHPVVRARRIAFGARHPDPDDRYFAVRARPCRFPR